MLSPCKDSAQSHQGLAMPGVWTARYRDHRYLEKEELAASGVSFGKVGLGHLYIISRCLLALLAKKKPTSDALTQTWQQPFTLYVPFIVFPHIAGNHIVGLRLRGIRNGKLCDVVAVKVYVGPKLELLYSVCDRKSGNRILVRIDYVVF